MVRRLCILCFLVAFWPGLALAQSAALIEAYNRFTALFEQGRYAEAEPFAVEALRLGEKEFGPVHHTIATLINNLAKMYQDQGRYDDAETLYRRTLALKKKVLGPSAALKEAQNQFWVQFRQRRLAAAEPFASEAIRLAEKEFGTDDPWTRHYLYAAILNLTTLYRGQGRDAETEPLLKRILEIAEKGLGPDESELASHLGALAFLYKKQRRHAEAEPLYKRILAIREKARGPDHPSVDVALNNLATVYEKQRRYAEAEPLYERSLAIREKARGTDHPDVGQILNRLAALYWPQGRHAETEPLYKRALAIQEKARGPDHRSVFVPLNNLATLYEKQRRYAEAEPLYKRALAIQEKFFGPDHPRAAKSRDKLAFLAGLARAAAPSQDTDTMEARLIAARRYADTVDFPALLQGLIAQMGQTVPPNKRNEFRQSTMRILGDGWVEKLTIDSMVQVFTTNELNKLAEFYGSTVGKSVIKKFPRYTANQMIKLMTRMKDIAKNFKRSTAPVPGRSSIVADNAFEVFGKAGVGTGSNDGITDMGIGDPTGPEGAGRRGVARFGLAGLAGQTLQSATLKLTILQSRRNDPGGTGNPCVSPITDNAAPFANPGLGDTNVIHIADPGAPDATDYQSASIGNDPGTLIAAGVDPPSLVSVDVKDAMQDAIDNGASFVAFRIQTAPETDSDGCNDVWFMATEEAAAAARPFIAFSTAPPKASGSTSPKYGAVAIQNLLAALGYDPGPVDGLAGPRTGAAVRTYQAEHSLRASGKMSGELLIHLSETARRRLLR